MDGYTIRETTRWTIYDRDGEECESFTSRAEAEAFLAHHLDITERSIWGKPVWTSVDI